jgi:hypothetical protein
MVALDLRYSLGLRVKSFPPYLPCFKRFQLMKDRKTFPQKRWCLQLFKKLSPPRTLRRKSVASTITIFWNHHQDPWTT